MKRIFLAFLLCAATLSSQDVKVIHLDKSVADQAQKAWMDLKTAEAAWEALRCDVAKRFNDGSVGYDFSSDFRVIVPRSMTISSVCSPGSGTVKSWVGDSSVIAIPNRGTSADTWKIR